MRLVSGLLGDRRRVAAQEYGLISVVVAIVMVNEAMQVGTNQEKSFSILSTYLN